MRSTKYLVSGGRWRSVFPNGQEGCGGSSALQEGCRVPQKKEEEGKLSVRRSREGWGLRSLGTKGCYGLRTPITEAGRDL